MRLVIVVSVVYLSFHSCINFNLQTINSFILSGYPNRGPFRWKWRQLRLIDLSKEWGQTVSTSFNSIGLYITIFIFIFEFILTLIFISIIVSIFTIMIFIFIDNYNVYIASDKKGTIFILSNLKCDIAN